MGLAICKQLVTMMGGRIGVSSTPGRGSVFTFTVCLEQSDAPILPPELGELAGARLLIADQQATSIMVLRHLAEGWGMQVTVVQHSTQALAALRTARAAGASFDLALIDVVIADQGGFPLTEAILADPDLVATPVILMTAYTVRDYGQQAQRSGVRGFLTRPIREHQLRRSLSAALSGLPVDNVEHPAMLASHHPHNEPQHQPDRLLVVEDNTVNQRVTVRMLEKLGYRADVVPNGQEALAAIERLPYRLILMDCHMPVMDGFTATAAIRQYEANRRHTPIIALTANALTGERERCLASGMDDYLAKPISLDRLRTTVERWLEVAPEAVILPVAEPIVVQESLIDRGVLESILDAPLTTTPELVRELIGIFLQDAAEIVVALDTALDTDDVATVHELAHTLKGSCANLGLCALRARCMELEVLKVGDDHTQGVVASFAAVYRDTVVALNLLDDELKLLSALDAR